VCATAAQVAFHGRLDGLTRPFVRLPKKYRGSQQHSCRAESALEAAMLDKGPLQGVQVATIPETFDRDDVFTGDIAEGCLA
jgi:hypothetical protein